MTFALNHLSYFLLTHLLLPSLTAAAPARIVNVASEAHRGVKLDFDDLQGELSYNRWLAYKRSKLANLMFTYGLARRIAGQGVTVNALHPGFVATDIGVRHRFVPSIIWWLGKLAAVSPEKGARTSIHLASAPEVAEVSGQYFIDSQPVAIVRRLVRSGSDGAAVAHQRQPDQPARLTRPTAATARTAATERRWRALAEAS